jgi:ArsR family transcriptional regulator
VDPIVIKEIEMLHDRVCYALADPKRLMILYHLSLGRLSVGTLSTELELPQTTVSRHLRILRDRGLVEPHREGTTIFYSLSDARIIQALDLMRELVRNQVQIEASIVEPHGPPDAE